MKQESKVSLTYVIEREDNTQIKASHETGEPNLYLWEEDRVALTLTVDEVEDLTEALKILAVKMRHESAEPTETTREWAKRITRENPEPQFPNLLSDSQPERERD